MERIARAFLLATGLAYTVLLFYAYAYFADASYVRLKITDEFYEISNNTFFYTGLILPAIVILVCYMLATIIKKQPISPSSYFKNENSRKSLYSWSISLAGAFNLFFASLLTVVIFINNEEGLQQNGYVPLLIVSLLIIVFWILWLPLILIKNK
ncbi:hypothetical protein JKA74_04665 [Marivirga sp. S37H4]|uniref:DUF1648 domain-containing protein n=1 Tax=Marivirga aurantiaca TaxID=2802615 RepID=A0A934WWK5_9BACT|nr:hypothetical protein [Marivirga aurantiaca]MBK6264319.1 hypothetical protein [Marivirga aurantiaca]